MDWPVLVFVVFAFLATLGAAWDLRTRRIPNWLTVVIGLAGLSASFLLGGGDFALSALAHLLIALVLGLVAFRFNLWGGGDGKFYAALAAWFGLSQIWQLMLAVSLSGLLLFFGWFAIRRFWRSTDSGLHGQLPYGVAIAAGGTITMALPWLIR